MPIQTTKIPHLAFTLITLRSSPVTGSGTGQSATGAPLPELHAGMALMGAEQIGDALRLTGQTHQGERERVVGWSAEPAPAPRNQHTIDQPPTPGGALGVATKDSGAVAIPVASAAARETVTG